MSAANSENSSSNFTLYPLLWLAVCFAFGILAEHFLGINWNILLTACLVFATLTVVFLNQKFALMFLLAGHTKPYRLPARGPGFLYY